MGGDSNVTLDAQIEFMLYEGFRPDLIASLLLHQDIARGEVERGAVEADERMSRYRDIADRLHRGGWGKVHA